MHSGAGLMVRVGSGTWPLKCAPTPALKSRVAIRAARRSTHSTGVYDDEVTAPSLQRRLARSLCSEPNRTVSTVQRDRESFDCTYRHSERSKKSCRHGPAGSKLWVGERDDRAQRIWHRWLFQCRGAICWK